VNTGSLLQLRNTNVHNNTPGDGLDVVGNSLADVRTTTIQNNGCAGLVTCFSNSSIGVGVFIARNSVVSLHQNALIQNNGDFGIWALLLSTVVSGFSPPNTLTTVQGHNVNGIVIQEGPICRSMVLLWSKQTAVDVHLRLQFPAAVSSAPKTRRWSSTASEPSAVITEPASS